MKMSLLRNKFETTVGSNELQKTSRLQKVLRGENKMYTQNLKIEILWQILLRLFEIRITSILMETSVWRRPIQKYFSEKASCHCKKAITMP